MRSLISDEYQLNIKIPDISDLIFCFNRFNLSQYVKIEIVEANWEKEIESAGYERNISLIQNADYIIIYDDGNCKRTKHLITIANQQVIPIEIIPIAQISEFQSSKESVSQLLDELKVLNKNKQHAIKTGNYEYAAKIRDDERKMKYRIENSCHYPF